MNSWLKAKYRQEFLALSYFSYIIVCFNYHFFNEVFNLLKYNIIYFLFNIFFLTVFIICLLSSLFLIVSNKWIFKPLLTFIVITSAAIKYFQQKYNILFDYNIFQSVLETNIREMRGYFNLSVYLNIFLYSTPVFFIWLLDLRTEKVTIDFKRRIQWISSMFCIALISFMIVYKEISWMIREHNILFDRLIPVNLLGNSIEYFKFKLKYSSNIPLKKIDKNATRTISKTEHKPVLMILVLGETVRAANWGLNHYERNTTPLLSKQNVINFNDVKSCGTLTAISLPCMFSPYGLHDYDKKAIMTSESLLHLLSQTEVSVLWRDNQTGCKGVCENLDFEDMGKLGECRNGNCLDEVLLQNLEEKISKQKDMILVLHMNGNHGPAYYQRYPKSFEYWKPSCHTSNFSKCTSQEIINAYDNAILYTDNILSELIDRLKKITSHKTGMIYVSDHGESLGEYNLYLHGLPYLIAPDYQKKVPMIMWFSKELYQGLNISESCLKNKQDKSINHDYLFSSILKIFSVQTRAYQARYDLFNKCVLKKR